MSEINWENPFDQDLMGKKRPRRKKAPRNSPSDSYADRFRGKGASLEDNVFSDSDKPDRFSEHYLQGMGDRHQVQDVSNEGFRVQNNGVPKERYQYRDSVRPERRYQQVPDVDNEGFRVQNNGVPKERYQYRDSVRPETSPASDSHLEDQDNRKFSAEWRFFDLKNKKQTGDLYKKILYFSKKKNFKVFNFVSSRNREGVSTVVANLVDYVNSQAIDKKVLVIDANLRSSSLGATFNIHTDSYGLVDVLNNRIDLQGAITAISSNIFFLSCGQQNMNHLANLELDNVIHLVNSCRELFDYIFIDCPPVLSSPDALSVAPASDITFVVIQSAKVQRPVVEKTKSLLQNDECEIGGVVLNRVQQVIPGWVYNFI